jgi:hypothetical protein
MFYRFYLFNRENRFVGHESGEFDSDRDAMTHAHEIAGQAAGVEVWHFDRVVGRVVGHPAPREDVRS